MSYTRVYYGVEITPEEEKSLDSFIADMWVNYIDIIYNTPLVFGYWITDIEEGNLKDVQQLPKVSKEKEDELLQVLREVGLERYTPTYYITNCVS